MKFSMALGREVAAESAEQFRMMLAYCDPAVKRFDLSRLSHGLVAGETRGKHDLKKLSAKILKIAEKTLGDGRVVAPQVLRRVEGRPRYDRGLDARLKKDRSLVALGADGWALHGASAALLRVFDEDFRALSRDLGAVEAHFPSRVDMKFLRRINYFNSFPHYTTFAAHLKPDVAVLDGFMERMRGEKGPLALSSADFAPAETILSPTICYHAYNSLQDRVLGKNGMTITATGRCCRWESANLSGLTRLWEFTMRELIFLGEAERLERLRQKAIDVTLAYCRKLGLSAWIESANDPFFSDEAGSKRFFQRGFGLKLELRLPYAADGRSLAAASFNNMQTTFGQSCAIRLPGGKTASSGCVGWGLERWVYAFLAQRGEDPARWPKFLRARL